MKQLGSSVYAVVIAANVISLNLLDVASTIFIIQGGLGYEANSLIGWMIGVFSLQHAMFIKLIMIAVGMVGACLYLHRVGEVNVSLLRGRIKMGGKKLLLIGFVLINLIYIVVILNNVLVIAGVI